MRARLSARSAADKKTLRTGGSHAAEDESSGEHLPLCRSRHQLRPDLGRGSRAPNRAEGDARQARRDREEDRPPRCAARPDSTGSPVGESEPPAVSVPGRRCRAAAPHARVLKLANDATVPCSSPPSFPPTRESRRGWMDPRSRGEDVESGNQSSAMSNERRSAIE